MIEKKEPSIEEVTALINQAVERMKHAKSIGDKIGYDIALKEYERLHKEYSHIIYKKRQPAGFYTRRV